MPAPRTSSDDLRADDLRARGERSGKGALALVLAVFALLSGVHAYRLPVFEGPDETGNLLYVRFLAAEGRLARPSREVTAELELLDRGIVPPLWFLTEVPLFRALGAGRWQATATLNPSFLRRRAGDVTVAEVLADPAARLHFRHGTDEARPLAGANLDVRILRATSVLWGTLAILAVWLVARRVVRDGVRAAWAAGIAATTPELQHLSGTISMDPMLAAWGGLCLWACVAWCDAERLPAGRGGAERFALLAGVFAALACLTKLNGLVLLPLGALAAWLAWRDGARFLRPLACFALGALLVGGPYYGWSWAVSGHPLWGWHYQSISPYHNPPGQPEGIAGLLLLSDLPRLFEAWLGFASTLFLTWFADFGWTAVWFPGWVTAAAFALLAAGAAAAVAHVLGKRRARWRDGRRTDVPLVFLLLAALLMLAAEVFFNLRFPQPHGRHLYPFLPAFVVPVAFGLARLRLLRATVLAQLALSLVAIPVLLGALRPEGWNADPRWSVTDELRQADPDLTDPARAAIEWLGPEPGATLPAEPAPVLRWRAREGALYDVVLAVDDARFRPAPWDPGRIVFRTLWAGIETAGELPLPASFWGAIERGQVLSVQVIELDEHGAARGRSPRIDFEKGG